MEGLLSRHQSSVWTSKGLKDSTAGPWQPLIRRPLTQVRQEQASDLCEDQRNSIPEKVGPRNANKEDQHPGPVWLGFKAGRELACEQIQSIRAQESSFRMAI